MTTASVGPAPRLGVMVADRILRYGRGQTLVVTVEAPALSQLIAVAVGYESVSRFSRESARMFGSPPRRETRRALKARVRADGPATSPDLAAAF